MNARAAAKKPTYCIHKFLEVESYKTLCVNCGRDFYLYADVDPSAEIDGLKAEIDILKEKLKWRNRMILTK